MLTMHSWVDELDDPSVTVRLLLQTV